MTARKPGGFPRTGSSSTGALRCSTRTTPFELGAWTNSSAETAIPTCEAPRATVLKKTRSPGSAHPATSRRPASYCSDTVRGTRGPAARTRRPRTRCSRTPTGRCRRFGTGPPEGTGPSRRPAAMGRRRRARQASATVRDAGAGADGVGRWERRRHGARRRAAPRQQGQQNGNDEAHPGRLIGAPPSRVALRRGRPRRLSCGLMRALPGQPTGRLFEELAHLQIVGRVEHRLRSAT